MPHTAINAPHAKMSENARLQLLGNYVIIHDVTLRIAHAVLMSADLFLFSEQHVCVCVLELLYSENVWFER